jgi:hypothetical protein
MTGSLATRPDQSITLLLHFGERALMDEMIYDSHISEPTFLLLAHLVGRVNGAILPCPY